MKLVWIVLALLAAGCASRVPHLDQWNVETLPHAKVEAALPESHPYLCYLYAARLFKEDRKSDALFWFYAGQLRFRFELTTRPDDNAGGPMMGSLNVGLGYSINGWGMRNIDVWVAQIERVLEWDARHPNPLTSKTEFAEEYREIRAGLEELKARIVQDADQIRRDVLEHDSLVAMEVDGEGWDEDEWDEDEWDEDEWDEDEWD